MSPWLVGARVYPPAANQFHDLHFGATLGRNKSNKKRWVSQKVIRCHPFKFENGCFGTAISFQIKRQFLNIHSSNFVWNCHESFLMAPNSLYKHPESSKSSPKKLTKSTCPPNQTNQLRKNESLKISNINKPSHKKSTKTQPTNQPTNVPKIYPTQPTNSQRIWTNSTNSTCLSINRLSKF